MHVSKNYFNLGRNLELLYSQKDAQIRTLLLNCVSQDSGAQCYRQIQWSYTEDYAQVRPLTRTDSNAFDKEFLQENPCYFTLKKYSNNFQHCFAASQQRIETEVPQIGTKHQ